MDAGENLKRAVRFENPESIPVIFHINAACWRHYPPGVLRELIEAHPLLFPDPAAAAAEPEIPPYARAGRIFTDPWECDWETKVDGLVGITVRHPLESWDALDAFCPPDPERTNHWVPMDWAQVAREAAEGPGLAGWPRGVRNVDIGHNHTWLRLIDLRGYQNVLLDMAYEEPRLWRLIEMLEQFNEGLVRNYIRHGRVEWMGFAEDLGMQTGPMLPPAHFRQYIQPSYRRLMRLAREAGCIVHVHADGQLHAVCDDLLACGLDVLNLQDLVNGLDWIEAKLAGKICLELDIDRQRITPFGAPAAIDALVREEVERLGSRQGGLMLIYGLYPGVPPENARAVMDAMERYAGYFS